MYPDLETLYIGCSGKLAMKNFNLGYFVFIFIFYWFSDGTRIVTLSGILVPITRGFFVKRRK